MQKAHFLLAKFRNVFSDLLGIFFPPVCLTCDRILHQPDALICHHCMGELSFTKMHLSNDNPIYEKLATIVPIEAATSLLFYDKSGVTQGLIHQLKYHDRQDIGKFFATLCYQELQNSPLFKQIDYILPVPLHPKKFKKRGYNQLSVFGENLGNYFSIAYDETILLRSINTDSQTKKSAEERRLNVANAFKIHKGNQYKGKHFLIIDDVLTTGATIEACAETIFNEIPDAKVSVLTISNVM